MRTMSTSSGLPAAAWSNVSTRSLRRSPAHFSPTARTLAMKSAELGAVSLTGRSPAYEVLTSTEETHSATASAIVDPPSPRHGRVSETRFRTTHAPHRTHHRGEFPLAPNISVHDPIVRSKFRRSTKRLGTSVSPGQRQVPNTVVPFYPWFGSGFTQRDGTVGIHPMVRSRMDCSEQRSTRPVSTKWANSVTTRHSAGAAAAALRSASASSERPRTPSLR